MKKLSNISVKEFRNAMMVLGLKKVNCLRTLGIGKEEFLALLENL